MIGKAYSTSQRACMIEFVGGPYHGQRGLFDHDNFDAIISSNAEERRSYSYKREGPQRYYLHDVQQWDN